MTDNDDEADVSPGAARRLLVEHCPAWADRPLSLIVSSGMDNAMYRLGDDLVLRLPRTAASGERFAGELAWLPVLARLLPVRVPRVRYAAAPTADRPSGWSVLEWIDGTDAWTALGALPAAGAALAEDLADVVTTLRAVDLAGTGAPAPTGARGGSLAPRDPVVREAIDAVGHLVDASVAHRIWRRAIDAPADTGRPVLLHADLIPGNLLVANGRLGAVIDWGTIAVGDPAADLTPAWWVLDAPGARRFRERVGADDAAWQRGAGWAIAQAALAARYYLPIGHALGDVAHRALDRLVADPEVGGGAGPGRPGPG